MFVRVLIASLLVATGVGIGTSAWALFGPADDTATFRPIVIGPGEQPATAPAMVDTAATPTPAARPADESAGQPDPWPPPEVRQKAIDLAVNDAETAQALRGHRYGAFQVNPYTDNAGPCSDPSFLSCVEVGFYDYTIPTGMKVIVDLATSTVVDRRADPNFQPGPSEEEFAAMTAIIAADSNFGPSSLIDPKFWPAREVNDTDQGGRCGLPSPLHRCLLVKVDGPDGRSNFVVLDLVDSRVVIVYPNP